MEYEKMLGVEAPKSWTHVVREVPTVTQEQRRKALEMTHYNEFAFPAGLLYIDCLSDSGTTSMTDTQWSAMFLADESRDTMFYWMHSEMFGREVMTRRDSSTTSKKALIRMM